MNQTPKIQESTDTAYARWAKEERRIYQINRRAHLTRTRENEEYAAWLKKARPWEADR